MRTYLAFLLALMLSLNAAYATSVGVSDTLEHTSDDAAYLWHHSHGHGDNHGEPAVNADGESNIPAVSDHHHAHVHPSTHYLLSDAIGVTPLEGRSLLVSEPTNTFISVSQALLDRPPKAILA